jgi:hypothetical protein
MFLLTELRVNVVVAVLLVRLAAGNGRIRRRMRRQDPGPDCAERSRQNPHIVGHTAQAVHLQAEWAFVRWYCCTLGGATCRLSVPL